MHFMTSHVHQIPVEKDRKPIWEIKENVEEKTGIFGLKMIFSL